MKGGYTDMCKYLKNNGIVVRTSEQKATINKVILASQESKSLAPKSNSIGEFDSSLWKLKKSL